MVEMEHLKNQIEETKKAAQIEIEQANSVVDLDNIRRAYVGKKGAVSLLLKEIAQLSQEEKKIIGPILNKLKHDINQSLEERKISIVRTQQDLKQKKDICFDITAYQPNQREGHLHPYTLITRDIEDIFLSMGYQVLDGPELETDFYNFTALNIPQDHPARDMYDTFWTNYDNHLLRTHTSPVQIRTMQQTKPPIAAIVPGRTYRHEAVDASHSFMFMQCEGLYVDKNVSLSHLFGTIKLFLKALFRKDELEIRTRPGFFPFVEPGFEIDMRCPFCQNGCAVCKKTSWIEICPGGLVHPNVLKICGINPDEYSGFAFGFGLSRLAMLKYNIKDIRLFHSGKLKFLHQF